MKQIYVAHCYKKAYIHFMEYVADYFDNPQKQTIERRLGILKFSDEFGLDATRKAFKVSRSTIFLWKKKLYDAGGKLSALSPSISGTVS